jgi:ApaG protein
MYMKTTHHISVSVDPVFLEDQSLPLDKHYVWAYSIWIENQGPEMVQLLKRTWHITDAHGVMHEGIFHMKTKSGKLFDVSIPAFSLDSPYETASVH